MREFFGKYRGKVENNVDPLQMGRIQVSVPAVLGDGRLSWAMPCVPYAGKGVGFFAIPPVGANVWVEFEGGDPDYPIWSGCFWGRGEVPAEPAVAEMKVFKTDSITLILSDLPGGGGLTLEVGPPAVPTPLTLVFDSRGVEITAKPGSLKITPTEIELTSTPATVKLSSRSIELSNGKAAGKFSASGIELSYGAINIKLTSDSVSINNGAWEVK